VGITPFANNVVTKIKGNPNYLQPTPELAEVTTQINTLETATHDAMNGGKILIATRNAEHATLLTLLRQLAAYVQTHCQNDYLVLIGSGFEAVRAPSPVGILPAPQNPRLETTGMSGELLFRCDRLNNSVNITVQTATNPAGPWTAQAPSTSTRVLLPNLTPGTIYWARALRQWVRGPRRVEQSRHCDGRVSGTSIQESFHKARGCERSPARFVVFTTEDFTRKAPEAEGYSGDRGASRGG